MTAASTRVANIGPRERRKRLLLGVAAGVGAVALAVVLLLLDTAAWWRLGLFAMFWFASLGVLQATGHT